MPSVLMALDPDRSDIEATIFGGETGEDALHALFPCWSKSGGPLLAGSSHRGVVTQEEQARIRHAEQVELEAYRAEREARSRREIEAGVRRFEERQAEKRYAAEERQARKRALAAIIPIPPTTSLVTAVSPGWIAHMASGRIARRP